jgi:competence protein ComEC
MLLQIARERDCMKKTREKPPPPNLNRPLVWAACGFAAGIILSTGAEMPALLLAPGLVVAGIVLLYFERRVPWARHLMGACLFAAAGVCWSVARQPEITGNPLRRFSIENRYALCSVEGTVRSPGLCLPGDDWLPFQLAVDRVEYDGREWPVPGRVLVNVYDPEEALYPGDRVRLRCRLSPRLGQVNPGVSSAEERLHLRGIVCRTSVRGEDITRLSRPDWYPPAWAARLRHWAGVQFRRALPEESFRLVAAVWLGDRKYVPESMRQAFIDTGVAHILSVSGIHVGIIYLSAAFILRLLIRRQRLRVALTLGAVFLFALSSGARIPTVRAAIMVSLYLMAELFEREPDAPTALGLAALLFLVANPMLLFDGAFQLSFLSVASILVFARPLEMLFQPFPYFLRIPLSASVSVLILPLPFMIYFFHVVPLIAPLMNLVIVPLLTLVLWLAFFTIITAAALPASALLPGHAIDPVFRAIRLFTESGASADWLHPAVVSPALPSRIFLIVSALTFALAVMPGRRKRIRPLIMAGTALAIAFVFWRHNTLPPGVYFLDIHRGDAIVVRSPAGKTMLIDGGDKSDYRDMGEDVVLPFLLGHGIRHLDCVVNTHPDRDHIGGLSAVVDTISVGAVFLGPEPFEAEQNFLRQCAEKKIPVRRVARGDSIPMPGIDAEVLHPPQGHSATPNEMSVVLRITMAGRRFLMTGDIGAPSEAMLPPDIRVAVLKAPHHGSRYSSSPAFLQAAAPRHAVFTVKPDRRKSPVPPEIMQRYAARDIAVWRTDWHGGVRCCPSEKGWFIESARQALGLGLTPP